MPGLNFRKRFAGVVESGEKRQTIRATRSDGKPHAVVGDRLYLYTGMRTKGCRNLGEAICSRTSQVAINEEHAIIVDGTLLRNAGEEDAFARRDGFATAEEMINWFRQVHGLPFEGSLIAWSVLDAQQGDSK